MKKNLKNLVKSLRTKIGVRLECFWERNREVSRERSMEMRTKSHRGLIEESQWISTDAGIERYRAICRGGVEEMLVDSCGVEEVSRINSSKLRTEAWSIHQVSRSYRAYRPNLDRSTRYRGAGEIAIRKSFRKLDR